MSWATLRESLPLSHRVQRWDVYDAADHIADIPGLIALGRYAEAAEVAQEWERKLWLAAERGGIVGPYPEYRQVSR